MVEKIKGDYTTVLYLNALFWGALLFAKPPWHSELLAPIAAITGLICPAIFRMVCISHPPQPRRARSVIAVALNVLMLLFSLAIVLQWLGSSIRPMFPGDDARLNEVTGIATVAFLFQGFVLISFIPGSFRKKPF